MNEKNYNSFFLARNLDITENELDEIFNGELPITVLIAFKLEDIFNVPSQYWLNYQQMHDKYIL